MTDIARILGIVAIAVAIMCVVHFIQSHDD
jgi:hypothetical protein